MTSRGLGLPALWALSLQLGESAEPHLGFSFQPLSLETQESKLGQSKGSVSQGSLSLITNTCHLSFVNWCLENCCLIYLMFFLLLFVSRGRVRLVLVTPPWPTPIGIWNSEVQRERLLFFIKPAPFNFLHLGDFSLFLIHLPPIFTPSGNLLALPSNILHNMPMLHHLHWYHFLLDYHSCLLNWSPLCPFSPVVWPQFSSQSKPLKIYIHVTLFWLPVQFPDMSSIFLIQELCTGCSLSLGCFFPRSLNI